MAAQSAPTDIQDDWVEVKEIKDFPLRPKSISATHPIEPAPFYERVRQNALERLKEHKSPIFTAEFGPRGLSECFMHNIPAENRQAYTCSTCNTFLDRFGCLCLVNGDGQLVPLFWNSLDSSIDEFFRPAVKALEAKFAVAGMRVSTEFKATLKLQAIGAQQHGSFNHFYFNFPAQRLQKEELAGFSSAPTNQLAEVLERIFSDYQISTVRRTAQILNENKLSGADNHKAAANWLLDLLEQDRVVGRSKGDPAARHNLVYRYAASAFVGCLNQLRGGALSTLLDNVKVNQPWNILELQWRSTTNPTKYLRPQAAPKAGNIAAAERLFEHLGLTTEDMRRRYLAADDIPADVIMWQPQKLTRPTAEKASKAGKVFAGVRARVPATTIADKTSIPSVSELPPTSITFAKLVNHILPKSTKLEYKLDTHSHLAFFITGLKGSKPLMQWHHSYTANLASWFFYTQKCTVAKHNLRPNAWNTVTRIVPFPHLWDGAPHTTTLPLADDDNNDNNDKANVFKFYHKKEGFRYLFDLEGCRDQPAGVGGLMLFPELLKNDFHSVRATIEAYSAVRKIEWDVDDDEDKDKDKEKEVKGNRDSAATAKPDYVAGVAVSKSEPDMEHVVRVTDLKGELHVYRIVLFD